MSEIKTIAQIIAEKIGQDFNNPDPLSEQKVSERLQQRIQDDREFDTDEETEEKTRAYWDRVHNKKPNIISLQKQRIIFDDLYRSVLKVGTDIEEFIYFEKTKNDVDLKGFINDLLNWYFKVDTFKKVTGRIFVHRFPVRKNKQHEKTLLHMSMIHLDVKEKHGISRI